ncbi:hypothetical protein [Acinetobacter sp. YH12045]|nr:hypothetical protein [Acinetobacter sp. YH12045]
MQDFMKEEAPRTKDFGRRFVHLGIILRNKTLPVGLCNKAFNDIKTLIF